MKKYKRDIKAKTIEYALLWIVGCFAYASLQKLSIPTIEQIFSPILICTLIVIFINKIAKTKKRIETLALFVFFTITVVTLLGFSQTLSGGYIEESNPYLYGLSFYTASIAYYYKTKHEISLSDIFKISNPLLISTGPVAIFVKRGRHNSIRHRVNYYLPFIINKF